MATGDSRRLNRWRIIGWSLAGALILLPLVAMQFTDEVNWTPGDFVAAAVLLLGVGIPIEIVVRKSHSRPYRAAAVLAVMAAFLMTWSNGAVGMIGSENLDVNSLYYLLVLLAILASVAVRFKAPAMAVVMAATALLQALLAGVAAVAGWGLPHSGGVEILAINGFFIAMWAGSALLFHHAATDEEAGV